MKTKYKLHFGEYAIGENEKLYSDMSAAGWRLVKRGANLSKFEKAEPEKARYRIELSAASGMDNEAELPEEQIAVYEECGWEFVTRCGIVNVFRASEGSDAPEFYQDPKQQAQTMKALRRSYRTAPIAVIAVLALYAFIGAAMNNGANGYFHKLVWGARMDFVTSTAWTLFFAILFLRSVFSLIYGAVRTGALYRRLKSGKPVDHSPDGKETVFRAVSAICFGVMILCLILTAVQLIGADKYEMPESSDGPYMLLSDMGIEGERETGYVNNEESHVRVKHSLKAKIWDTFEQISVGDKYYWLYQDVYEFKSAEEAEKFVAVIMENNLLVDGTEEFGEVTADGLDGAWESPRNVYIALRGSTVMQIECMDCGVSEIFAGAVKALNR